MAMSSLKRLMDLPIGLSCFISVIIGIVYAEVHGVTCTIDDDCGDSQGLIRGVSVCENGKCTNPFEQGCLNVMSKKFGKKNTRFLSAFENTRICNSDDEGTPEGKKRCRRPKLADFFLYDEVRIAPGDWESPIFLSWIYQILLTELLEVPVTLEHGDGKKMVGSFYDRTNGFTFVDTKYYSSIYKALNRSAFLKGDCATTNEPCAHFIPEIWESGIPMSVISLEEILSPVPNGLLGGTGLFTPKYTAKNHPELSSIYGLAGEANRHHLAESFLTPVTWKYYCENFSKSFNCSKEDDVAKGPPLNIQDAAKYYHNDNFTGFFYTPPEGNCTINPENCTGHFGNVNCYLITFLESQLYWNDVYLTSRGPEDPDNAYSYNDLFQIWEAANATKNNVMMWFYFPSPEMEKYAGTEASFQRVEWTRTTQKCLRSRQQNLRPCSSDINERRGPDESWSCGNPVEKSMILFSKSLKDMTDNATEAARSPTFEFMSHLKLPSYSMIDMFENWSKIKKDYYGYDAREAVCRWVYDEFENLEEFIPKSYPREINERKYALITSVSYSLAVIMLIVSLVVVSLVVKYRKNEAIRFAQIGFLFWIITGFFFVSIAAIFRANPSSHTSCIMAEWSILIGFTLELVPILVKINAINKLARSLTQFERIEIDSNKLMKYSILFMGPVILYLIIWTSIDMPKSTEILILDKVGNGNIINLGKTCSSQSKLWNLWGYLWQVLLLCSASVLAFQSRNVVENINETLWISFLVYSHFMFLIFRLVAQRLFLTGAITELMEPYIMSILLSVDILLGVVIYFGPKFYNVMKEEQRKSRKSTLKAESFSSSKFYATSSWSQHNTNVVEQDRKTFDINSEITNVPGPAKPPDQPNSRQKDRRVSFKDVH